MTRRRWIFIGLAIPAVLAGGFVAAYFVLLGGNSPAPLTLSGSAPSSASPAPALSATQLPGAWKVASDSVAGYRVREQLAFLSAPSDAVGRTHEINGTVTLTASGQALTVSAADFTVDVSTLTSDRSMRDQRIHSTGLESDSYPKAMFTLTRPIAVPAAATSGSQLTVSATGTLTIHGTTKTVTIPLKAQLSGSRMEIVGSLTFPFEDFGMTPPSIAGFVSVRDSATLEFDLFFQHA